MYILLHYNHRAAHCRAEYRKIRSLWGPYSSLSMLTLFLADLSPDTRLILYADDMLLYKPITQDLVDLQSDTDKIGEWTRENFLTLIKQ